MTNVSAEGGGDKQTSAGPTTVRIAAKAVIIHERRLLTIKVRDLLHKDDFYHCLPGGGQQPGENLHEALIRECKEEIGTTVAVGELLFVRDYIGPNHAHAAVDGRFHQVELIFACTLARAADVDEVGNGVAPDARQVAVEWLALDRLPTYNFRPRALTRLLQALPARRPAYLGDVD